MSLNFQQLNREKTKVLHISQIIFLPKVPPCISSLSTGVRSTWRNLGIILDQYITKPIQTCFLKIRNFAKMKSMLSTTDLKVHAQVFFSHLGYSNAIYSCLKQAALSRLLVVQNAAARLFTCTSCRSHIPLILAYLHRLPVKYRTDLKLLLFTYKAQHDSAPSYIFDHLHPIQPSDTIDKLNKVF